MDKPPLIFIIAGEVSGDTLGAAVMKSLKEQTGDKIRFAGVGGEAMIAEGLESLLPLSDFNVMGLSEVVTSLPRLYRSADNLVAAMEAETPTALFTVDFKGFNLRLAERVRKRQTAGKMPKFPLIHMVAPTVWAWRAKRAEKIAQFLDRLFVLFPFEPPYFNKHGLKTDYVGHPAITRDLGDGEAFRKRHNIPGDAKVLGVFPGSRKSEVKHLLPVFSETVEQLRQSSGPVYTVTPTVSTVSSEVRSCLAAWGEGTIVVDGDEKQDAMAAMDAALVTSGTVALELAIARVPIVVGYRMNWLTTALSYLLIKERSAVLTNWIIGRDAVPQFLRGNCTPENLLPVVRNLLFDDAYRAEQIAACDEARTILSEVGDPAQMAASLLLQEIGQS